MNADATHKRMIGWLMAAASLAAAILILNRWAVTSLGLASYGRVWQFYINYPEFGFSSRAIVGSLVTALGLTRLFTNEYILAFTVQTVVLVALAGAVASFALRHTRDPLFLFTVFFSPVLILQAGYVTGALDPFLLLLATANMLIVRDRAVFAAVAIAGLLVHELSAFTLPAQFLAFAIRTRSAASVAVWVRDLLAPALTIGAALFAMLMFGRSPLDQATYERLMAAHIPHAAHQHPFWSGYFEVARDFAANRQLTLDYFSTATHWVWLWLALPCIYVGLATWRAAWMAQRGIRLLVIVACATPVLVAYVATDVYRWIGLAGGMAVLLTLVLRASATVPVPRRLDWALAAFVLVAPFGAAELDRPFPVQQLVVDRLLG